MARKKSLFLKLFSLGVECSISDFLRGDFFFFFPGDSAFVSVQGYFLNQIFE